MNVILADIMRKEDYNAGSKARNDVRDILSQNGFATHIVFNRNHNCIFKAVELIDSMKRLETIVKTGDIVILQYPYNINIVKKITDFLVKVKEKKKIRIIYLLHDVYYIRGDQPLDGEKLRAEEISIFNRTDCLIVHNEKMKAKLEHDGVKVQMVSLGLFDYLTDINATADYQHEGISIDFAGNLATQKSEFLYFLKDIREVHFNLYGNGYDGNQANVDYLGSYPPEQLVGSLIGDYGLVWDGKSINECEGSYGNYLRYNNPHKMSLYLAAEKPVIVWNQSALAEYVEQNQIGMSVSSITELKSIPMNNTAEYGKMKDNVKIISHKLRKGDFLLSALLKINAIKYS